MPVNTFQGIIPELRDWNYRRKYDEWLDQNGQALQSGDPEQFKRMPTDVRNPYINEHLKNAFGNWMGAGAVQHQAAQTGEIGARTTGMQQEQGFKQQEGKYAQDKFGAPTLGAANVGLDSQRLGLAEKDFGLRKAGQEADFTGSRMAAIAAGYPPESLTAPINYTPLGNAEELNVRKKELALREGVNTQENTKMARLNTFINSPAFAMLSDEQKAPYLAMADQYYGIEKTARVDPRADMVSQKLEEQQHAKNGQGPVVFGADTPPLNLQNPESNFNFWERAAMGAQGVPRALGLTNKPSIQEQVTGPQPTVWQRMGRFLDTRDNLPPIVPQGYENQPQPRQLPTPSALPPQRPREGQQQRSNPQPQALIQQQQDEQQKLLMAQFFQQFMGGQRG